MKCPRCDVDLKHQTDRGVEVDACPVCQGMWLTPAELDELENEAFDDEANKGSLYVTSYATELKCPVCSANMKEFDYRFYDLQLDCCPEHGFWLDKDEDTQILELMRDEKEHLKKKYEEEDAWTNYINHLRSPSFFQKVKNLFRGG